MDHFLPFYSPMDPKKTLEDIIILQMFTINDSHMIYGFSDMECNRQNVLSFWTVFCPFAPPSPPLPLTPTSQKIKILKNWKKHLEQSSFYTSAPKIMTICYSVPSIWHVKNLIVIFILGYFLLFYLFNSPKNQNLEKVKKTKKPWRYHYFIIMYQKSWSYATLFLRYGVWWV